MNQLKLEIMTKIIIAIVLFITSLVSAQGQFEQGMGKAFQLLGEGKNTEASAMFGRIAAAEKKSWLPQELFLEKAEFEIGGAKFLEKDTKPMCAQIEKAICLFATFKPETPFSPKWGLERALEAQKRCNK